MSQEWQKVDQSEQKVGYKRVTTKTFLMPDGTNAEYTTWGRRANNVAIIALTATKSVLVARQFRPGPERVLDELPGGGVEPGEELADAAARELLEETGFKSDNPLHYLGMACRDAYTNETNHYFLAKGCYKVSEQKLDENEHVEAIEISIEQLIINAKTGMMSDAVAVLMALDELTKKVD